MYVVYYITLAYSTIDLYYISPEYTRVILYRYLGGPRSVLVFSDKPTTVVIYMSNGPFIAPPFASLLGILYEKPPG